jgi:membrane-associated phospholipid phosphatase
MAIVSLVLLFLFDKTTIHLAINSCHNSFADFFFTYWTYVGDGLFVALAGVLIAVVSFQKYRWSVLWFGAATLMLSGAAAQLLKRFVFDGALRPSAYLADYSLYFVEGVKLHGHHSFPSGHTTAAFAFFGFACFFLAKTKPVLQIVFALCAGLVGYSRMYLSQHFLEDVFAGLLLGAFIFMLLLVAFKKPLNKLTV